MRRAVLVAMFALIPPAIAAPPDYARQWPVVTDGAAGAYAVELTAEVYATARHADLRDVDVLDADGRTVPADVVVQDERATPRRTALPWYRMPTPGTTDGGDWRVIADLDADGRLRGLHSTAATTARPATTLLLDAGALRARPTALEISWRPGVAFDVGYAVEASDDFDTWYGVGRGRLVDVREGGRQLQVRRLMLSIGDGRARFLRLVPEDRAAALPDIVGVEAVWTGRQRPAPTWRVLTTETRSGPTFDFVSDGRYPVRWVDLDTPGNDARTWRLQSRDAPDARWVERTGAWVAYRVGAGRSPPRVFDTAVRDRYWRLVAQGSGEAPRLRLGHVPERLVFIAAGRPPYVLVAGSALRSREARPVRTALDRMPPAAARLGASAERAGDAALVRGRDWKTWGLWAVLGLGVLAVAGFALRVLRDPLRGVD